VAGGQGFGSIPDGASPVSFRGGSLALGTPSPRPPAEAEGNSETRSQSRRYRAAAAILFLGVTIFRRAGVGGCQASFEETKNAGAGAVALWPVRGRLRNLRTGHPTEFRLWIEGSPDSIVPVRIDFQPRSFLRLILEAEPPRAGG
jgi:hypothetical protein